MDSAVNEALRALNTANLRRYTDLQCPKARRRRLKAVQRLVRVLLGDPNVVCGTNTKGEVCLSGGACTALSGPLGGHLALTAQEHEALSMLRMACSMHLSQRALLRMPRRCTQRDPRTVRQRIMPYFPQTTIVKSTTGRNGHELWRVRELYTLTQVERHRALTTKFSKAWGDSGWSPTRWIHWCLAHSTFFAEKWRNIFQFSSIPTEYRHGPYKRRLKNCFKGWSLVRPSVSLRHMHHCMSMNALEQGLLGLEAAKATDIDDFV